MTGKVLLSIVLCCYLVFSSDLVSDTKCSAEVKNYLVSEQQLTNLEQNNEKLKDINKTQTWQLTELQRQVEKLKSELNNSKTALELAQKSLSKTQEYTKKLEKQASELGISKISPVLSYGNKAGFMAGIRVRPNGHYDVSLVGNSMSFVSSVAYNF